MNSFFEVPPTVQEHIAQSPGETPEAVPGEIPAPNKFDFDPEAINPFTGKKV